MSIDALGSGSASFHVRQQTQQRRVRAADAARTQQAGGGYDQTQYLRDLNDRLDANVTAGAWSGGASPFGKNSAPQVMVHPDFLRIMHDDPAKGREYEDAINKYAKEEQAFRKSIAAQGGTVDSMGMYIDEEGGMYVFSYTTTPKRGGGKDEEELQAGPEESMEELLEKLAEKRREEQAEARRAAEKDAAAEASGTGQMVDELA
jgi:hypothetical protein